MDSSLITVGLVVLHWTIAVGLSLRVLMRRRPRGAAFAWILLMLAIPYAGAAFYLFVGEVWLPRRRVVEITDLIDKTSGPGGVLRPPPDLPGIDTELLGLLSRQARAAAGSMMTTRNAIELLDGAEPAFERIIQDIDNAERTCFLLSYIWHPGGSTEAIAEALVRAAQRDVDCRVLIDAHGGDAFFDSDLPKRLRRAGVRVAAACPIGRLRLQLSRIDLRNHRKIIVIDSRTGYTGSLNIADPAIFKIRARVGRWVDCAVRVTGPAAEGLQTVFLNDWRLEHPDEPATPDAASPSPESSSAPAAGPAEPAEPEGPMCAVVLPSGPGQDPYVLRQMLLTLIYAARQEVVLTTPYFVPGDATLSALIAVARGGVRVRLILPKKVDALLVGMASRSYYQDLLDAGVEILHYNGGLLHSKTATVDGEISMLGSANMDLRSFELNLEVSLFVFDLEFTQQLNALQERYAKNSTRLTPEVWSSRSLVRKMAQNVAQLVAPIL
ncbi:MAG: cardiolipin synthase [Phycisphaerales bacterium]|jgi:cardiolipin synthase